MNGVVILREIDCTDEDIKNVIRNPEKFSTCKHCTDERIKSQYPAECQEAIYLWCLVSLSLDGVYTDIKSLNIAEKSRNIGKNNEKIYILKKKEFFKCNKTLNK